MNSVNIDIRAFQFSPSTWTDLIELLILMNGRCYCIDDQLFYEITKVHGEEV